jgi:deoxyribose-phosphate aldolase
VRSLDRLLDPVAIGVTRFGATATAAIVDDAQARAAATGSLVVPPPPGDEQATDNAGY